jgi:hypothetical protein
VRPGRYHLLLTVNGRPAMHGWWNNEMIARTQFRAWEGERGRPEQAMACPLVSAAETPGQRAGHRVDVPAG